MLGKSSFWDSHSDGINQYQCNVNGRLAVPKGTLAECCTHICSSSSTNAVVVIEPILRFFKILLPLAATLTLPVSFDTKNTQIYLNFASVYAEYTVD